MAVARTTLLALGAIHPDGQATPRGRLVARVGVDPRLARALLDGAEAVGAHRAAEIVAMLSDDARSSGDLVADLRRLRHDKHASHTWRSQVTRLERAVPRRATTARQLTDDLATGLVVALAHPDRVARRRPGGQTYLLVSGTGAELPPGSPLSGYDWLAVADADRPPGRRDALIRSAAPLDEDLALEAAGSALCEADDVRWTDGRVVARRTTRLGAIELASERVQHPAAEQVVAAVREGLRQDGLDALPWREPARALRRRLAFVRAALGAPWPDVSDEALLASLDEWLAPDLARVRSVGDLGRIDLVSALRRLLPWPEAGRLGEVAPERVTLPGGARPVVDYAAADRPVVAVTVQEAFGWRRTPSLADGRVPVVLHLLSPARRPVAVTADLESFWATGYPQVRAELRRRYPKHAWPETPHG